MYVAARHGASADFLPPIFGGPFGPSPSAGVGPTPCPNGQVLDPGGGCVTITPSPVPSPKVGPGYTCPPGYVVEPGFPYCIPVSTPEPTPRPKSTPEPTDEPTPPGEGKGAPEPTAEPTATPVPCKPGDAGTPCEYQTPVPTATPVITPFPSTPKPVPPTPTPASGYCPPGTSEVDGICQPDSVPTPATPPATSTPPKNGGGGLIGSIGRIFQSITDSIFSFFKKL